MNKKYEKYKEMEIKQQQDKDDWERWCDKIILNGALALVCFFILMIVFVHFWR